MDQSTPPGTWIGEWAVVHVRGTQRVVEEQGWLIAVSELGVTLERLQSSEETFEEFYPWYTIYSVRPRPELARPRG
jgi:predicted FMN-binding regulatory protein PaiB